MASKSLTFELFGVDKTASSALAGVARAGDHMGQMLSRGAFVAGAALAATAAAAVAFSIDSIKAFAEAETAQTRLAFAFEKYPNLIGGNVAALQTMNTALQKTTRFEDDAIAAAQGTLAMYDLNADQLATLTPLMLDYAAVTGKDAGEAAEDLGKAILGQGRALKAVGLNFEDAGDPLSNYTQLVEGLRTQVQGFAEKDADTVSGKLDHIKNDFDAVQEKLGAAFAPGLNVAADVIDGTLIPALDRVISKMGPELQAEFDELAPKLEAAVDKAVPALERLMGATPDIIGAIADSVTADLQLIDDFDKISKGDLSPIARDNQWVNDAALNPSVTVDWSGEDPLQQYLDQLDQIDAETEATAAAATGFWDDYSSDVALELRNSQGDFASYNNAIQDGLNGAAAGAETAGMELSRGFARGINIAKSSAVDEAVAMADEVVGSVRARMQIQSPSKVMRDLGAYIPQGFALGIEDDMWRVNAAFDGMSPSNSTVGATMAGQVGSGGRGDVHIHVSGIIGGDKHQFAKAAVNAMRDAVKTGQIPAGYALA